MAFPLFLSFCLVHGRSQRAAQRAKVNRGCCCPLVLAPCCTALDFCEDSLAVKPLETLVMNLHVPVTRCLSPAEFLVRSCEGNEWPCDALVLAHVLGYCEELALSTAEHEPQEVALLDPVQHALHCGLVVDSPHCPARASAEVHTVTDAQEIVLAGGQDGKLTQRRRHLCV